MERVDDNYPGAFPDTIAAEVSDLYYMRVVLRDDQLNLIRQIIREELASHGQQS